jgi:Fur family ferric uptake transcriptional regulator
MDSAIEKRQQEIAKNLGFEIVDHALAIYGTCSKKNCAKRKKGK